MKVKIIVAIIALLALFTVCYSAEIYPSAEKTADASIKTGAGTYGGMIVITDGANACTVKVYDNTTNSGRVLDDGTCPGYVVSGQANTCKGLFPWPISYENGVYADFTTSGTCTYIIFTSK